MAVYDAEELDHAAWVNYPAGQVYVREVPSPLMVMCSLIRTENQVFEAFFRTMAGEQFLHIPKVLNLSSSMEEPLGISTVSDFLWEKLTKPRGAAE